MHMGGSNRAQMSSFQVPFRCSTLISITAEDGSAGSRTSQVHRYDACMGTHQVSRPPFLRRCNVKRAHLTCTTDVFYMYRSSVPPGVGFIPYVSYSSVSPRLGMTIYRGRMEATQETMQLPISDGDFSFLCLSLCRSWC